MDVVGDVGGNIGGQICRQEPGNLRPRGQRGGCAASDGVLTVGRADQFEIAVAAVEVPPGSEVMIHASDTEVAGLRNGHVPGEDADVAPCRAVVAATQAVATGSVRQRNGGPHLGNQRIDPRRLG